MTPRPTSPTSLLWAHQLKREHGHLLGRIQQLETTNRQQGERLQKAESSASAGHRDDIAALAKQVQALDESGIKQRLTKVEEDVMSKLEDVQAENEAVALKVASMEKDDVLAEQERRKALTKEKALLKRVGEVEESLKQYENSLNQVNRKVDENSVKIIKRQLESLSKQVEREGSEMKRMEDSLEALATAHAELIKANERLSAEMAELASRPAAQPTTSSSKSGAKPGGKKKFVPRPPIPKRKDQIFQEDDDDEDDDTPRPKKKSHKWNGGGADRDIIRQASEVTQEPSSGRPARRATPKRPVIPTAPSRSAPKPSTQPKHVAKAVAKPTEKVKQAAKPARKSDSQLYIGHEADKPIIRSGKGWVEYAMTPSGSDSDEEAVEVEGPRNRVRTAKAQARIDTLEMLSNSGKRVTRGVRQQFSQAKAVPQKRKADEGSGFRPSTTKEAFPRRKPASPLKKRLDVFDSPASSPISSLSGTPERRQSRENVFEAPRQQQAPPKRRRIDQGDDDDAALLAQYAGGR
jgi:hypothetical protein